MANDLIVTALLFGQYWIGRTPALNILAGGYLFTALIVIPHTLTFPGALSTTGLFGGAQSAAWLYEGWHAILPLTIIAFALRRDTSSAIGGTSRGAAVAILAASGVATLTVVAMTLLVTIGHHALPALIQDGKYTGLTRIAVGILLGLPAAAFLTLAARRSRSVLDLWLMIVMFTWLCTITLGAIASAGRFDVGWYAGRVFDWLASLFVLLILLWESLALYARSIRAVAIERNERQRRLREMEAILAHLGRVEDLGHMASSLIHEVNQPLAAINNYLGAGKQLIDAAQTDGIGEIFELATEEAARAAGIIRHLRDFITRRESDKEAGDIPAVLRDGIRLALVAAGPDAPTVEMQCADGASTAVFNRIQIEQVVFNLVRNAIEAMQGSARRTLFVSARLTSDDMVQLGVSDTGLGLSSAVRAKLFEPFVTTKASGLGVGLSICRLIVESHGGRLWADDRPGGGTTFNLTLPLASRAAVS
jgi:signal transduction histidine kinase